MRPDDRRYSKDHEWAKKDGDAIVIGITDHAVEQLGDLTFLELKVEPGQQVADHELIGEIESVKTVADIYAPMAGEIVEVNSALSDDVEPLAEGPYEAGWLIKMRPANPADHDAMLDAAAYDKEIEE
jgi:glycine cleavage system H protein